MEKSGLKPDGTDLLRRSEALRFRLEPNAHRDRGEKASERWGHGKRQCHAGIVNLGGVPPFSGCVVTRFILRGENYLGVHASAKSTEVELGREFECRSQTPQQSSLQSQTKHAKGSGLTPKTMEQLLYLPSVSK